ncbi:MAG: hypothetical protein ACW99A_24120 [Candidatus Kariarchaeaceae archaeon]
MEKAFRITNYLIFTSRCTNPMIQTRSIDHFQFDEIGKKNDILTQESSQETQITRQGYSPIGDENGFLKTKLSLPVFAITCLVIARKRKSINHKPTEKHRLKMK